MSTPKFISAAFSANFSAPPSIPSVIPSPKAPRTKFFIAEAFTFLTTFPTSFSRPAEPAKAPAPPEIRISVRFSPLYACASEAISIACSSDIPWLVISVFTASKIAFLAVPIPVNPPTADATANEPPESIPAPTVVPAVPIALKTKSRGATPKASAAALISFHAPVPWAALINCEISSLSNLDWSDIASPIKAWTSSKAWETGLSGPATLANISTPSTAPCATFKGKSAVSRNNWYAPSLSSSPVISEKDGRPVE